MPILLSNRRTFIKKAVTGLGAIATVPMTHRSSHAGENGDRIRLALLSDTHVPRDPSNEYRGFKPFDNMKQVVSEIVEAKPEGAIITGDLARLEGFAGDYASLLPLLDPLVGTMPVAMGLGNHDNRRNFHHAFSKHPGTRHTPGGKHVLVLETPAVRMIVLDSLLYVNHAAGLLGKAQRDWLRQFLRTEEPKPTILFFHHTLDDSDGSLLDVERLFPIIMTQSQVKAIVYGHSHVYHYSQRFGIHLINLPAVGYNFNDKDPVGWIETELGAEGGQFTLHTIGGNQADNGVTTALKWRQ